MKNKVLVNFLLKAGGLYVLWHLIYQQYFEVEGTMIRRVAEHVATMSVGILRMFGYSATTRSFQGFNTMISMNGKDLVWIDSGCTGLTLMALFAGFVIAYPGPLAKKLWYIPLGLLVIYVVNLARVVVLCLNHIYSNASFAFNHKYTYTLITYAAIFGLWMIWANRFKWH